jgi:hypothetical protein
MSEVDGRFVKRGLWTNLEHGNVMGKTITTDSTTGTIVIAAMAILSTVGKLLKQFGQGNSISVELLVLGSFKSHKTTVQKIRCLGRRRAIVPR